MRSTLSGALASGVTAKNLALAVIARIGAGGGHAIEARLTLCNMATELSAFAAIVAPDDATFAYLHGRPHAP